MGSEQFAIVIFAVAIAALAAYGLAPSQTLQSTFCNVVTSNSTLICDNSKDTLTLTSSDNSITITGNNTTDTINLQANGTLVQSNYCASTTCTITNIENDDTLFVWAKGTAYNSTLTATISLNKDSIAVDSVTLTLSTNERQAFALLGSSTATSTSHIYTVTTTAGNLEDVKILVQAFR